MRLSEAAVGAKGGQIKLVVIALVLGVAGAILAYAYLAPTRYYPVVTVAAPEGLTYVAVQDARSERKACVEANERFLAPIKTGCTGCKVVASRCEPFVQDDEAKTLLEGGRSYLVIAPGLRMAIGGPDTSARRDCDAIAKDMASRGIASVACIYPKPPA